jgi:aminomethyltransferase
VFLIPNAANTSEVVRRLAEAAPDGIAVENRHDAYGIVAVQGPRSDEVLRSLGLPTEHDYMGFAVADWDGRPVIVCRTGYTGERGYELVPRWEDTPPLWDALTEAMAGHGGLPCGLGARDTLRTEMGYPLHGQDLSLDITPVQARAGWAVGWKKPQFWGREALVAEKEAGPARQSWGLLVTGRGIPRQHCAVTVDGRTVGEVTSGTFSPTLRQGIALALLEPSVGLGADVVVDVRGRDVPATVVKPPFVEVQTRQA